MAVSVLIADDAAFMRQMIKNILKDTKYEVIGEARNGIEAITKYKELQPNLITLDITMPQKNGIDVAKEILEYDEQADIIMCSAMGQQKMVLEAIQAGARNFVVKPFQPDRLLKAFDKVINTKGGNE